MILLEKWDFIWVLIGSWGNNISGVMWVSVVSVSIVAGAGFLR